MNFIVEKLGGNHLNQRTKVNITNNGTNNIICLLILGSIQNHICDLVKTNLPMRKHQT